MNNQSNLRAEASSPAVIPAWDRPFAIAAAVAYFISLIFPVVAGLLKNTGAFPKWWGTLDVGLAFFLAILAFVIYGLGHGKVNKQIEETTYRAYRKLIHVIFVLILIFFIAGDNVIWINGLPGIAWRAWLLLYILPEWFAIMLWRR
jgi:hypothetical protein